MDDSLEENEFDRLLAGSVVEAWARCIPLWRTRGRIEDLPRNLHIGSYRVSQEKWLGRAFAETYLADWPFVASKLSSLDPVEAACAHDTLKYMIECGEPLPVAVWAITAPLPHWVKQELLDCPTKYATFSGSTLGELFQFEYEQGL